jgi:hypothetical protein
MGTSMNLKDAARQYIQHLEETGQKASTVGTARRTLDLLIADMGENKEVGKILPVHVAAFFKSEAATMQPGKDGPKPRAQASILQIRRIVRAALVWWHEQGYAATVPVPKEDRKFLEPRKSRKTEVQPAPQGEVTHQEGEHAEPQPQAAADTRQEGQE